MTNERAILRLEMLYENCQEEMCEGACVYCLDAIKKATEALEREPKRGKWIKDRKFNTRMKTYVCSNCKHRVWGDREKMPYCPNCGSRMEGNEE